MDKDWESKKCVGDCPKCGKNNLNYGLSEGLDDTRVYPFTCEDCGCEGRECYSEIYTETEYT